jgi:hypothetical protein
VLLTPVPDTATEFGELVALLTTVTVPLALPVTLGANTTFRFAVCPAESVVPLIPLVTLNPEPLTLICEMVKLEFPVFFAATSSGIDPPRISLPKFKLVVASEIVRVAVVPVPLKAIVCVALVALLLIVTVPVTPPAAAGLNATVKFKVFAGPSVNGVESPLILNPAPLTLTLDTVTLDEPVFSSCTVCEFVVPSGTLPKLTLYGVFANGPRCSAPCPSTMSEEKITAARSRKLYAKYRRLCRRPK